MSRIAFIGAGRMASAMVTGMLRQQVAVAADLGCTCGNDPSGAKLAEQTGISYETEVTSLLADADTVILACKPQQLDALDRRLPDLTAGKLIISILAGTRLQRLRRVFPEARYLVRAMPNTPGQIGAGITGFAMDRPMPERDYASVTAILGALGEVVEFAERELDMVTAVSGSGPAYLFEFTAALEEAGLRNGLSAAHARQLARATVIGAARLLEETGANADDLRNQVTSPGGTTEAALRIFSDRGFRNILDEAVAAARDRSDELAG
jgi:pyrroline-5-carboxylate reductase